MRFSSWAGVSGKPGVSYAPLRPTLHFSDSLPVPVTVPLPIPRYDAPPENEEENVQSGSVKARCSRYPYEWS